LHSISTYVFLLGPEDAFPPPSTPASFWQLSFDTPEYERWLEHWTGTWPSYLRPNDARELATDFDLDPARVDRAAMLAQGRAAVRNPLNLNPTHEDLRAAGRTLGAPRLGRYAIRIVPRYQLKDLVLPPDRLAQLSTLVSRARHRDEVQKRGYGGPGDRGQGLPVLFAGPSGTGKTMAAEIVAGELGLDLFTIDLSSVVSKYIGETEQNLNLIFEATHRAPAVLFFDEADSLCGKRTEIKDAHDRYANLEVNFLLQRIERHSGIVILATNFQQNIDSAFLRRFVDRVDFPLPDEAQRRDLWERQFPEFSREEDDPKALKDLRERIDFAFLARQFAFTGASIRNAVLHAAFAAASRKDTEVTMLDVIRGVAAEYRKQGRLCSPAEFGSYYKSLREDAPHPA
jgi:DNA polymerase III delta prime subunit